MDTPGISARSTLRRACRRRKPAADAHADAHHRPETAKTCATGHADPPLKTGKALRFRRVGGGDYVMRTDASTSRICSIAQAVSLSVMTYGGMK